MSLKMLVNRAPGVTKYIAGLINLIKYQPEEVIMRAVTLLLYLVLPSFCLTQIYVDDSYPYGPGPFEVNTTAFSVLDPDIDGLPYHSGVHYPITEEIQSFGVYYFITGFFGTMPSSMYSDFFTRISSHGYIVFVTWVTDQEPLYESHLIQIAWLEENVPGQLGGAMPSFDHMTICCHSSGCAPQIKLMINHTEMFMAAVNFDPSTFAIQRYEVDVGIPVLNLGSEWAKNNQNGTCVFETIDYKGWHERSICPRIMMEAEDAGHCDIINEPSWEDCVYDCGGPLIYDRVDEFKNVLKGNAVAFTGAYVQGNMDQLKYVADESLIPWTMLEFEADVDC